MSHLDPAQRTSTSELRKFGLLVGGTFLALGGVSFLRHKPAGVFGTMWAIGGALAVAGLVSPQLLNQVYSAWMRLAHMLSKFTTPIFMGVVYFLILAPVGWIGRTFSRRPFGSSSADTGWVTRPPEARKSSLERQF